MRDLASAIRDLMETIREGKELYDEATELIEIVSASNPSKQLPLPKRLEPRKFVSQKTPRRISDSDIEKLIERSIADAERKALRNSSNNPLAEAFKTLGILEDAPREVVEAAYKAMAKKYHPDVNKDVHKDQAQANSKKMMRINEAYDKIRIARGWK